MCIQESMYQSQSNIWYLIQVLKCSLVQMYTQSSIACGVTKSSMERLGWYYDDFIVSLTRGFATKSALNLDNTSTNEAKMR